MCVVRKFKNIFVTMINNNFLKLASIHIGYMIYANDCV